IGVVSTPEPYQKRTSHGMILGENGEKMSKSRGNVVNPDEIVAELGADAFRVYEMFMGAFDQAKPWSTAGARGARRFLDRVWRLLDMRTEENCEKLETLFHQTIKKVTEDYEKMKFNTAVAAMMTLVNGINDAGALPDYMLKWFLQIFNPIAPHITEEMWQLCGYDGDITFEPWPEYDPGKCIEAMQEMAVQINGKVRARITFPAGAAEDEIKNTALSDNNVVQWIAGKQIIKFLVVPGRLVNIVVK
ncbi:MAG: class I tRNA ligase family protein, partial [Clostridia bacterium]|nr:class I tRNA ligase family protein [Clostridia bacterium]